MAKRRKNAEEAKPDAMQIIARLLAVIAVKKALRKTMLPFN